MLYYLTHYVYNKIYILCNMYIYTHYVYVCMYVCIYIYIYTICVFMCVSEYTSKPMVNLVHNIYVNRWERETDVYK